MKYIVICLFTLTTFTVQATSYAGDIIHINGEEWNLLANPIEEDSALLAQVLNFLPEERDHSTSNWYGYTAHWEMREGWLYLTGIKTEPYDEVHQRHSSLFLNADTLRQNDTLFPCRIRPQFRNRIVYGYKKRTNRLHSTLS